ncbi:hypothetical protein pb186bvf_021213 [Paramecium bursaria]
MELDRSRYIDICMLGIERLQQLLSTKMNINHKFSTPVLRCILKK